MKKHITSEHAGLKWERLRLQYLRKCRRTLYTELLATDKLNEHLGEINEQADSMFSQLVKQLVEQQGITEELKAENQLLWVQQMNNVQNVASEIVLNELIYCWKNGWGINVFSFKKQHRCTVDCTPTRVASDCAAVCGRVCT